MELENCLDNRSGGQWILVNISHSLNGMCTEVCYDGSMARLSEVAQEALPGRTAGLGRACFGAEVASVTGGWLSHRMRQAAFPTVP